MTDQWEYARQLYDYTGWWQSPPNYQPLPTFQSPAHCVGCLCFNPQPPSFLPQYTPFDYAKMEEMLKWLKEFSAREIAPDEVNTCPNGDIECEHD